MRRSGNGQNARSLARESHDSAHAGEGIERVERIHWSDLFWVLGLVVAAFALGRLQTDFRDRGEVDPLGRAILTLTAGPAGVLAGGLDGGSRFWAGVFGSGALVRENERLRAELALSRDLARQLQEERSRNDALRRVIQLPALSNRTRVAAEVVDYDPGTERMTLRLASSEGVEPGQAVIAARGLVGRVQAVSGGYAQALMITSTRLRIGAMVTRAEPISGILRGMGKGMLLLEISVNGSKLKPGELVQTSLHGERIPPFIPIGDVVRSEPAEEYGLTRVIVQPAVGVAQVREVYVLR